MEHTVRFLPSGRIIWVSTGTSLLQAARWAGLPVASSCGERQACALCGLEIVEGSDALGPEPDEETRLKQLKQIDSKLRLSCKVGVTGDLVARAHYW